MAKNSLIPAHSLINLRGKLLDLSAPRIMGILNATPDSFYNKGRDSQIDQLLANAGLMLQQGASILDIGGMSSRPKSDMISSDEESERILPLIEAILKHYPQAVLSVDTWRAAVARQALDAGVHIINDISGGQLDPEILSVAAKYHAPYICMHMQGTPQTMQDHPQYEDVVKEILDDFIARIQVFKAAGTTDIILDPGFGFGKTIAHNYALLKHLSLFHLTGCPILAGISRKSMVYKPLNLDADHALNATTALHMVALLNGANILRVHDVREAMECVTLYRHIEEA
ncbi:MAG: dihydropteroate synthase [Chitinophagaceae bacterium]|nr:dihydropteroate synthase [Chitinophagaceae bacterium]